MGERLLSLIRKEFTLLDDPDITRYMASIGQLALKEAGTQYFDYHFFVINERDLNAFAAPSGLIFVNSGLIETISSEDELLSVLAHECGHVVSRHIAKRMEKSSKVGMGTMAGVLAGILLGAATGAGGELSEAVITGSMAAGATMNLKFSREDEAEADHLALDWMQAQDRNPKGMLELLRKLRQMRRLTSGTPPPYLLTHPEPEVRMGYVQDWLADHPDRTFPAVDQFNFLRIKYRIYSLTREPGTLIPHYQKEISRKDTPEFDRSMDMYGLSQAYLANDNLDKAEGTLKQVMERFPDRKILSADLGVIYYKEGRYEEAIKALSIAREDQVLDSYPTFYLAKTYHQTGNLSQALTMYEGLLPSLPDYSKLYYELGNVYTQQDKKGAAAYYLGVYNWLIGDVKMAKYHLRQAVKELPEQDRIRELASAKLTLIEELTKDDEFESRRKERRRRL